MNGRTQETQIPLAEDGKPVAYCQHCGLPLNKETVRVVGPAVYCEPCLAARLTGASPTGASPSPAYGTVNPGAPPPASAWTSPSTGRPNPGLAMLLGLIPGVGAMYNEQYAKGIAHLFIFAVLVSLSHLSEVFGLLVSGWVFYMAIEAHHTAKARRDGTPLPNPFGLNDVGERLGFDPSFRGSPHATQPAREPAASGFAGAGAPPIPPYDPPVSPEAAAAGRGPEETATSWGAPTDKAAYGRASDPASAHLPFASHLPFEQPYRHGQPSPFGYPPPVPPYASVSAPPNPVPVPASSESRFPTGAIGLMVLGTIFLLGTTGIFHNVSGPVLVGFGMIGLGAWVFTRRFTGAESIGNNAGALNYRFRIVRALTPSSWLVLIGTLVLLDALRLVRWAYSWPWILIFAGVLQLIKRAIHNGAEARHNEAAESYGYDSSAGSTPPHPLATDLSQEPGPTSFRDGR